MRNGKIAALLIAAGLLLASCGQKAGMHLNAAPLTAEEQAVAALLGDSNARIYDFAADESLRSVEVNFYTLGPDSTWQETGGMGGDVERSSGRFAVRAFGKDGSLRVAIQDENDLSSWETAEDAVPGKAYPNCSTLWADAAPLEYGKEIPLAIRISTSETQVRNNLEAFYDPASLAGHELVQVVTVVFSTSPL